MPPAKKPPLLEDPQNLEAEKALLGSIFFQNEALDDVADVIRPEMFYLQSHRKLYEAVLTLQEAGKRAFDTITVGEAVEAAGTMEEAGGWEYLQEIIESVPHAAHARYYAEQVREKYLRRRTIYACSEAIRKAHDQGADIVDLLGETEGALHRVMESSVRSVEIDLRTVLLGALDRLGKETAFGISTEFDDIDRLTNGWPAGSLIVLAARPSVGKTSMLLRWLMNACQAGVPVMFFSLEQTSLEVADRLLSFASRVPLTDMRKKQRPPGTDDVLIQSANKLDSLELYIDADSYRTSQAIASLSRRQKRRKGLGLIAIDYLELIEPEDRRQPREQQLSDTSRSLKRIAKELNVPLICLAQLNREIERRDDKRPRLSDLRGSGSIEQDADMVMFLDRPAMYDDQAEAGEAILTLQKNRNGKTGRVPLFWDGPTLEFRPATGSEYTSAKLGFTDTY
jgi:replicative DNA helicase